MLWSTVVCIRFNVLRFPFKLVVATSLLFLAAFDVPRETVVSSLVVYSLLSKDLRDLRVRSLCNGYPLGILFWGGSLTGFDPFQAPQQGGLRNVFWGQAGGGVLPKFRQAGSGGGGS
jgi:hypothetical protein